MKTSSNFGSNFKMGEFENHLHFYRGVYSLNAIQIHKYSYIEKTDVWAQLDTILLYRTLVVIDN